MFATRLGVGFLHRPDRWAGFGPRKVGGLRGWLHCGMRCGEHASSVCSNCRFVKAFAQTLGVLWVTRPMPNQGADCRTDDKSNAGPSRFAAGRRDGQGADVVASTHHWPHSLAPRCVRSSFKTAGRDCHSCHDWRPPIKELFAILIEVLPNPSTNVQVLSALGIVTRRLDRRRQSMS